MKNVPLEEVFEILKISYDGLDWREKEIFLDIACFQTDEMPRKYADYLWEARYLYPKSGVKVLINKSLIKIDSNGDFWIHDQLRDMGREIIQSKGDGRPERRTRLWDPEDGLKIVLQKQVMSY
ncbi:hypothetical protein MLD38_036820 [Melastoma candidum]|uniref:Uncharacterized protein n=1 Tax=Melastoma candidum TaxID=119954 RepID=A0ACB9LMR1_9MYRT|nr:hypothetical protein MLD38_036820 [Melastoma candidum]